jgi:hypothetical protein
MSPELPLILACLKFPEKQYSEKIFLRLLRGWSSFSSESALS